MGQNSQTSATVVGAIAGLIVGYVIWLMAVTVGDDLMTVGQWSLAVLLLSCGLAVSAVFGGLLMRLRRKYFAAAFAFGLPILPVVLALAVLVNIYV